MIEKRKQNSNACLYFQEYKKGFAFSTKFLYFSDQKWHILHLKKIIFFWKFFLIFSKKNFRQISPNYDQKRWFQKIWKKILKKKKFFSSCFFFENHNKFAKNRQITKMLTVPNRQDFEVFITYWFFEFGQVLQ